MMDVKPVLLSDSEEHDNQTIVNAKYLSTDDKNELFDVPTEIGPLAYSYAHAATSAGTRSAYRSDIRHFIAWGGLLPTTPEVIIKYLEAFAGVLHPSTLKRRLTAIKQWHNYQELPDPTYHPFIRKMLVGISRVHGSKKNKATALRLDDLIKISQHLEKRGRLIDWRNNALLQIGFFGALRRSELVVLEWEDITFCEEGLEIELKRSKTDQEGKGEICAIPHLKREICPVKTLKKWQELSGVETGPIFLNINKSGVLSSKVIAETAVSRVLKLVASECNLPNVDSYSAHSLRRGFATAAAEHGACFISIMRHGRWKNADIVNGYIEEGRKFEDNALDAIRKIYNDGN